MSLQATITVTTIPVFAKMGGLVKEGREEASSVIANLITMGRNARKVGVE